MKTQRFFHILLVTGTILTMLGAILCFKQGFYPLGSSNHYLISQNTNTYLGPKQKVKGSPQIVRVQILVNDDPSPQGLQIVDAEFDGTDIPLKPRDIYGFRGQASFQSRPGKYKLRWRVNRDKVIWPRTVTHEEEVTINPRDMWIQITIIGEKASIS